ncbi:hypothetical protein OPQ81_004646 [Rhizoctonia solani]|nr:hypothetical protein OPQ81_004646 [Rhizoctonia solani]
MVKKFLESKDAELLLVAQVIDSSESARMKRSSQRPNDQANTPKKKISHKSHKLDAAKLAVKQQEKNKRLARKKMRRSENSASNTGNPSPGDTEGELRNHDLKVTQPTPDRRAKRVSFA